MLTHRFWWYTNFKHQYKDKDIANISYLKMVQNFNHFGSIGLNYFLLQNESWGKCLPPGFVTRKVTIPTQGCNEGKLVDS